MRIPGLKTARKTKLWLKNKLFPGALIMGYHRIAKVENDSFYNCTSPTHFAEQMEVLQKFANPLSMDDLISCLNNGEPPPKSVCVTVDDGYADALYNAKPILEKYGIPATVFVTTGNLGGEFWWDELERYILSSPEDAGLLKLKIDDHNLEFDFNTRIPAIRTRQMAVLADYLRPLEEIIRKRLLADIKVWSGSTPGREQLLVRSMTPDELVSLTEGGLIQIGSHTVTHPVLSALTEHERRYEIIESKHALENILAKPITGLSYPNGSFLKGDPELVSKAGYFYACASKNGTVRSKRDRYTIPRFWINDVDGDTFQRWIKGWL